MKRLMIFVFLIGALFARRYKADHISLVIGEDGTALRVMTNGVLIFSNVNPVPVFISNVEIDELAAVTNGGTFYVVMTNGVIVAVTNSLGVSFTNFPPVAVSNFPTTFGATNTGTFYAFISNIVGASITSSIPLIVSNVVNVQTELLKGQHGEAISMDSFHWLVDNSNFYRVTYYNGNVANNGLFNFMFVASNTNIGYYIEATVGGEFILNRYRNPIFTNAGTRLDVVCQNDYGPTNFTVYFYGQPVVTNYGTAKGYGTLIPGGNGASKPGATYRTQYEIMPSSNSIILLQFSNSSGGAAGISIGAFFYREN